MSGHRDSAALRAKVDAALDPGYERAFGLLDALTAHQGRNGSERDPRRLRLLTEELDAQIARLDARSDDPRGGRRT